MGSAIRLLVLTGALFLCIHAEFNREQLRDDFHSFISKFNKKYEDQTEFERRFEIYVQNRIKIEKWNKELEANHKSGRAGATKFADWTEEEFRNKILMAPGSSADYCKVPTKATVNTEPVDVPPKFDWREKHVVTPVKDQGSVGTCWAFSTTGNIEGQWALHSSDLVSLSEEQLNDCDGFDCGVFGGWPCRAMQYVIDVGGLMTEKDYPYCVGTGACYPCMAPGWNETFCGPPPTYCNSTKYPCKAHKGSDFAAHISSWQSFSSNETQLAAQLVQYGPISVLLNAGSGIPPLQFHEWGVYDPYMCDPDAQDHAVLMVGYGVESSVFGDTPYWLIKNSWGTDWSNDGGYFLIRRGEGTCGINVGATGSKV